MTGEHNFFKWGKLQSAGVCVVRQQYLSCNGTTHERSTATINCLPKQGWLSHAVVLWLSVL